MRLHTFGPIAAAMAIAVACGVPSAAQPVPHPAMPANPVGPAASPSAVPLLAPLAGPIPAGLPVILYQRSGVPPEILGGASWSGTRYEGPTAPVGQGVSRQSPDGTSFLWGGVAHDIASGRDTRLALAYGDTILKWADDSKHVCFVAPAGTPPAFDNLKAVPVDIFTILPGSPAVLLGQMGVVAYQSVHVSVLACSFSSDRAVIAQVGGAGDTQELWLVRISTGAIESHTSYPPATKTSSAGVLVRASPNGKYLSETDTASAVTTVRALPGMAVVRRLEGRQVLAFSWNADLLIASPRAPGVAADNTSFQSPEVVSRSTGAVVWSAPAGYRFFGGYIPEPGGDRLALSLSSCATTTQCTDDIWIVSPSGQGLEVDRNVHLFAWGF